MDLSTMGWVLTHLVAFVAGYAYGGVVTGWISWIIEGEYDDE